MSDTLPENEELKPDASNPEAKALGPLTQQRPVFICDNEGDTYEFIVENDRPIKLGDGSFGSVFHVLNRKKGDFAAKLFYQTDDTSLLDRFKSEMRAKEAVLTGLRSGGFAAEFNVNLVLAEDWSENFVDSVAYSTLKNYFDSTQLSLCGFVAVMPLYRCTLKEVLERGAPENRLAGGRMVSSRGERGYDLLRKMSFPSREDAVLAIAQSVALGLRALHAANLSHHDLKPANVLIRGTGKGTEFAIADFGFVKPNESANTNLRHVGASVPVGTRHYRSKEQRDYFDVCEVDVEVKAGERTITITTLDRKFEDSIIEEGDTVMFFKDPGAVYSITGIDRDSFPIRISVHNNQKVPPASDQRTQAIFYKSQTLRTDLFGLGALVFDLLTAGRSPENFSDYLRPRDDSRLTVDSLEERYRAYRDSSSGELDLVALFDQLGGRDFAFPEWDIVQIVLKCMLSEPPDSYYKMGKSKASHEHFRQVCEDIAAAMSRRNISLLEHPLWGPSDIHPPPPPILPPFLQELASIRSQKVVSKRLISAYKTLMTLVGAVKGALDRTLKEGDNAFFFNLGPENLRPTTTGIQLSGTYTTEAQYQGALLSTMADSNREAFGNNFTPPVMRFRSRRVKLLLTEAQSVIKVQFSYSESQPLWQPPRPGDYFRYNADGESPVLYQITKIIGHDAEVSVVQKGSASQKRSEAAANQSGDALLIRSVRPVEHYLSMLGIYIHHLFFTVGSDNGALPEMVWSIEQARCAGLLPSGIIGNGCLVENDLADRIRKVEIVGVQERVAKLYLWLVCRGFTEDGDWTPILPKQPGLMAFEKLNLYLGRIREALESLMKLTPRSLDVLSEDLLYPDTRAPIKLESDLDSILSRIVRLFN